MVENKLVDLIINNLSDDLLKKRFLGVKNRNKYTGHCYVATETLFHLLPDDVKSKYKPSTLKINDETHWFLKNVITGEIIDPTKKQFNFDLKYDNSRYAAFLTKKPSKRSLILINRIYEKINL
jgi:hypothetical protein